MGSLSVPPHHDVVVVAVADAEDVRGHGVGGARLRELPLRSPPLGHDLIGYIQSWFWLEK